MGDGNQQNPTCFGLWWEGQHDPTCTICGGQTNCLKAFTQVTLAKYIDAVGEDPAKLSELTQVSIPSITEALRYRETEKQYYATNAPEQTQPQVAEIAPQEATQAALDNTPQGSQNAPTEQPGAPQALSVVDMKTGEVEQLELVTPQMPQQPAPLAPPPVQQADPAQPQAPLGPTNPVSVEPATARGKNQAKKPTAKSAKALDAGAGSEAPPTKPKKKRASPLAGNEKKRKRKSAAAMRKKDPRRSRLNQPWGKHTYRDRFRRERQRSQTIRLLQPGTVLKRKYKGQEYTVEVGKDCYLYQGREYPTLYMVVEEIAGTKEYAKQPNAEGVRPTGTRKMCGWSACRFFNLEAAIQNLYNPVRHTSTQTLLNTDQVVPMEDEDLEENQGSDT